jgi:hypothetical protein
VTEQSEGAIHLLFSENPASLINTHLQPNEFVQLTHLSQGEPFVMEIDIVMPYPIVPGPVTFLAGTSALHKLMMTASNTAAELS